MAEYISVGEISKVLFGTLDKNDTDYYDEQIHNFERNSEDTTDLLKQQVYVIKSTLGALNDTLADMEHNDKLVRKGLSDIQTYLDTLSSESARKLDIFEAKLMIENHITQVNNALLILQRNIDLVLDSVLHAQSGSIQPQVVPPKLLLESLKESQSFFPRDTIVPFPLSKDATTIIYKVCEVQVYIQNNRLSYVVSVPPVNKVEFKAYNLVPVPISVNKDKLVYIRTTKSILCVDKTRQYYCSSSDLELQKCKEPTKRRYVCKQDKPLLSSLVQEDCAVRLLKVWKTLPISCKVHLVKLTHTVWTQVNGNEWIYYAPGTESMTVLCNDRDPVDIPLKGAGKLVIDPTCKGYSKAALLQPMRSLFANSSNNRDSQLIQVKLHNECHEELGTCLNLSTLNLDLNFRETISHADDLSYAGIKVIDLQRHVLEHEWKEKHSTIHYGYSIGLYVIIGLLCFYIVFRLIHCMNSRGTCQRVAGVLKLTSRVEANPGNVININIKTSNESLASNPENIPLRALKPSDSKTGETETRPTHRLRPSCSYF